MYSFEVEIKRSTIRCKYLPLIAMLTLTLFSCEDLEHSNPNDPLFVLERPGDLTAEVTNDSEIILSWRDNSDAETGFRIERDAGSGFTAISTVQSDVTEYTDSGLTYGQSCKYRVAAFILNNMSDYSEEVTATACLSCVVDIDGNLYATIQIGDQVWMAENLKVTHYRDGSTITNVTNNAEWAALSSEGYCIQNNNDSNELEIYGALYNWYAATDSRKIAPEFWHVPTEEDWTILTTYLGGGSVAGGKMKEAGYAHWNDPNTGATNESGFTALPGGYRYDGDGSYRQMGDYGYFWSALEFNDLHAYDHFLIYDHSDLILNGHKKKAGFSVRCLRD